MHYCCNSGMAQKISKKMSVLRDSAKDNPDLQSSIGEKLIALHPGISPDRITADVQEIYNGIRVFSDFYDYFKENGYLLYSGKLPQYDAFRIGNIGEISDEDVDRFITLLEAYFHEVR